MTQVIDKDFIQSRIPSLKPQCENCFGLCCVALFFSKLDGFPEDKSSGTPCPHLDTAFRCTVYDRLEKLDLKGCISYECLGAGQQVSQITFSGKSWKAEPTAASAMFDAFLRMRQLQELRWYLLQALLYTMKAPDTELFEALQETEKITLLPGRSLLELQLPEYQTKIFRLLSETSSRIRADMGNQFDRKLKGQKKVLDLFGKDLRKRDLRCADLRGACLIAANLEGAELTGTDFTGADLRDTNLEGADLSQSLFLTQFQLNCAKGDTRTRLPEFLERPKHWF